MVGINSLNLPGSVKDYARKIYQVKRTALILKYVACLEYDKELAGAGKTCLWKAIVGDETGEALGLNYAAAEDFLRNGAVFSSLCFAWEYCHSVIASSR